MDEIQLISLHTSLELPPVTAEHTTTLESRSIYHPLPAMHIRVLDILPIDASISDPNNAIINAEFRVINLKDDPKFTALSYVWREFSQSERDYIICGNVHVDVSILSIGSAAPTKEA